MLNEAHGTGTALGDPIEAGSLVGAVLSAREEALAVGGVKANIGHAEPAAGMTGLLKLALGLRAGEAAPNAQLRVLNPHAGGSLRGVAGALSVQLAAVRMGSGGVSSFGYSGTIAHAILDFGSGEALAFCCDPDPLAALTFGSRGAEAAGGGLGEVLALRSRGAEEAGGGVRCSQTDPRRSTLDRRGTLPLAYRRRAFPWREMAPRPVLVAAIGCEIHLTQPGSVLNLTIRAQRMSPRALTFNEATIKVQAAGLNFRDVLNVLGLDPTGTVRPIGGESAGIVSTAGPACRPVLPSEDVYGFALGSLRTHTWCDARYIRCVPRTLETTGTAQPRELHISVSVDSRAHAQWHASDAYL